MVSKTERRGANSITLVSVVLSAFWGITMGAACFEPLGPNDADTSGSQVAVTPRLVTLSYRQTQQFSAALSDPSFSANAGAITWSATGGTITQDGLYTAGDAPGSFRVVASVGISIADTAIVTVGGTDAADPELPRTFIDTRFPPTTGSTIEVNAGNSLQTALNNAQPGDQIVLQAGANFEGTFTLPAKSGSAWIIIRSSAFPAQLPPEGTRVDPSFASAMPKLVATGNQPALRTAPGAHHYRIVGVELTVKSSVTTNYGIVTLGDGSNAQNTLEEVPHDLVLDRVYIHGHSSADVSRCVGLNSAATAIIDSYLSECHAEGFDAQAIGGWNGPGPFKIVNNYLAGSGENIIFGGADPSIPNLTPSDIEIRRNHFHKPASWRGVWTVKNLLELKHAQRVLIEGNVFENNWPDAQVGWAIIFKSENQEGTAPWSVTRDITFRYNWITNSAHGLDLSAVGSGQRVDNRTSRVKIHDNVFDRLGPESDFGGDGRMFMLLNDHRDVKIVHNTAFGSHSIIIAEGPAASGFVFKDNLMTHGRGVIGTGTSSGIETLEAYMPGYTFERNVLIGGDAARYPAGNFFPVSIIAVRFADLPNGDYRLGLDSRYRGQATDGKDPGANIGLLENHIAGVR
jgi:hypothetical protein